MSARIPSATRESEENFRLMSDFAPVLIWMSGIDKLCTFFNKPWLDFTGRTLDQEVGNGWAEGVHPDDLPSCLATYVNAFERREEFRMEYRLRRYDGEYRYVYDTGVPRFKQDGTFEGYIGSCVDVTERKRTEEKLRETEERFRLAAHVGKMFAYEWDLTTGLIVLSGESAHILDVDERATTSHEELMTHVHPDDREKLEAAIAELSPDKPNLQISYRRRLLDGTLIWVERKGLGQFDSHGKLVRMVGLVVDITERKQAEQALIESNGQLMEANQRIEKLKETLEHENAYLQKEIRVELNHQEIVGRSEAIRQVLMNAEQVAPTNSAVLLLGETGTGKELIARAIHRSSKRKDRLMVKVNCAALPASLVENELFGREKGAYTGALAR